MKSRLSPLEWLLSNEPQFQMLLDSINPHRIVYGNPHVFRDLELLNAVFLSYQVHQQQWSADTMWQVYGLPDKSKEYLEYKNIAGSERAQFKCLPYAHLLGREFTLRVEKETSSTILQAVKKAPRKDQDPVLRMWRVWNKAGPSALSRYPFRLLTQMGRESQWNLLRPEYTTVMAARFYADKDYEITGRRLCSFLYDKETGAIRPCLPDKATRICSTEQETCDRCESLLQYPEPAPVLRMVPPGPYQPWGAVSSTDRWEEKACRLFPNCPGIENPKYPESYTRHRLPDPPPGTGH